MKNSISTLILCLCWIPICLAQKTTTVILPKKTHVILGTSIGFQWGAQAFKYGTLNLDVPLDEYRNLSLQFTKVYGRTTQTFDYYGLEMKDGFEIGLAGKFFLHGRFTGHKSGFFVGPDIRYGSRTYEGLAYNPLTFNYDRSTTSFKQTKLMLSWGMQWHFGKYTIFSLSAPIGYEAVSGKATFNTYYSSPAENSIVVLPTLMLGIAL